MADCACGSGQAFDSCCGRYIAGEPAPTPEALMRARYTSFKLANLDFIENTCTEEGLQSLNRIEMEKSVPLTDFRGFELRGTAGGEAGDDKGTVTFSFRYRFNGTDFSQAEIAHFRRIDGHWLYDYSEVNPKPAPVRVESIGRNDPCTCGSGKKYKKCCGAAA
jgi:SEC-C motif domain protein